MIAMKQNKINIPKDRIVEFCRRRKINELALFGSVLRDDFHTESDIDVLVSFAPETHYSLFDLAAMQDELKTIFARQVDLIEKAALRNPFRRQHILNNMKVIYAT